MHVLHEGERRARDGRRSNGVGVCGPGVGIAAGQRIRNGVEVPQTILHGEVEAKQLADPVVLRHCREPLVEQVLEAVVVRPGHEVPPPEIRPPVAYRLHEPNQLAFIHGELEVPSSEGSAEEGEGSRALVEDDAKPRTRSITVHDKDSVKVWHLQHGPCRQGVLECPEGQISLVVPGERVSSQEAR